MRITQPAMSRQLRKLEQQLGAVLFVRGEGALRLTPAGSRFYDRARNLLAQADSLVERTRTEAGGVPRSMHVVAPSATVDYCIAPVVAGHGLDLPLLDCEVAEPFRVFEVAQARGADIGISTGPPPPSWRSRYLFEAPAYAHVPSGHRLYGAGAVEITRLVEEQLILLTPANAVRTTFDLAVTRAGLAYEEPYVVGFPMIAQAAAASGRGIAVLTDHVVFGLDAVPITVDGVPLSVPIIAGWSPTHPATETIEHVLDVLVQELGSPRRPAPLRGTAV